jgi:hypothetical protein
MKRLYNIRNSEGGVLGQLEIEPDGLDPLNLVLTPIVQIDKDVAPDIEAFLLSPRTELDPRPRETEWPYRHLGFCVIDTGGPDVRETLEFEERGIL